MNIEYKITLWAVACIYAIVNAFIYSWTFWSSFDINILQFVSFSEIIPSILYIVFLPCTIMILMLTIVSQWDKNHPTKKHNPNDETVNSRSKFKTILSNTVKITLALGIFYNLAHQVISLKEMLSTDKDMFWLMIRSFIGITITYAASDYLNYKTNFLSDVRADRRLIIIICIIPFICNIWAATNSYNIKHGKDTLLIQSDAQCNPSSDTKYRYISSISEKVFALSLKDGSICVFKYNYLKLIPENNTSTKSNTLNKSGLLSHQTISAINKDKP